MKVYIACSSKDLEKYIQNYKLIRDFVLKSNHKISGDWLSRVLKGSVHKDDHRNSWELKDEGIKQLLHSDCLIADVSVPSTSVGYQIGYALSREIPVLCLYSLEFGQKESPQIIGVSDISKLKIEAYTKDTLEGLMYSFLKSIPVGLVKFNFIITSEIEKYIDWGAKKYDISKSEFLREKVIKVIKSDSEYQ